MTTKHGEQHFVPHGFQTVRKAWTGVASFGVFCWTVLDIDYNTWHTRIH